MTAGTGARVVREKKEARIEEITGVRITVVVAAEDLVVLVPVADVTTGDNPAGEFRKLIN